MQEEASPRDRHCAAPLALLTGCPSSPTFLGVQRGYKQTPQHPPCTFASAESPQPIAGHSIPHARATSPGTPCLCHKHRAGRSAPHNWGMLGAAGLLSPLQRKPEVRGH